MTNLEKAKELRQFVCNTHMANGGKALNMLSLHNQRNADLENIWKLCEKTALEMAQWKDEQYLENVEDDAKSYIDGVAKANPDLSEWVLNFMETAYIAGRNRIK